MSQTNGISHQDEDYESDDEEQPKVELSTKQLKVSFWIYVGFL